MFNRKLKTTLQEQQAELAARQAVIDAIDRATARIEFAPDGTVLFANELFLATMKYRSEEVLGQHHRMFCDEAYANSPDYLAHWQRLRRGEPVSRSGSRPPTTRCSVPTVACCAWSSSPRTSPHRSAKAPSTAQCWPPSSARWR